MYTKILFNNIKEFTPKFIKTIPFAKTVAPKFYRGVNRAWPLNQTPSMIKRYKFIYRNFYGSLSGQLFLYFVFAYGITQVVWQPYLYLFKRNNDHRQMSAAIEKENAYWKKLEEEEEDEDDEEEDEE